MSYAIALNEGSDGKPATAAAAKQYAGSLKLQGFPVTADPSGQLYKLTPWDGNARPAKCALAPDMTIVKCWLGKDDTAGFKAIQSYAAAHPPMGAGP